VSTSWARVFSWRRTVLQRITSPHVIVTFVKSVVALPVHQTLWSYCHVDISHSQGDSMKVAVFCDWCSAYCGINWPTFQRCLLPPSSSLVNFYRTAGRNTPEDSHRHSTATFPPSPMGLRFPVPSTADAMVIKTDHHRCASKKWCWPFSRRWFRRRNLLLSRIWGSHGDEYEEGCLLDSSRAAYSLPWWWRQYGHPKRWWTYASRHGTRTQKTATNVQLLRMNLKHYRWLLQSQKLCCLQIVTDAATCSK
jgi:hypothetical protein